MTLISVPYTSHNMRNVLQLCHKLKINNNESDGFSLTFLSQKISKIRNK